MIVIFTDPHMFLPFSLNTVVRGDGAPTPNLPVEESCRRDIACSRLFVSTWRANYRFKMVNFLSHPNRLNDVLRRSIYRPMLEATRGRRDSIRSGALPLGRT